MCQDWANLLVAVLSILVTILIGWQIYTAIDIKKTIKELKSRTNKQYEDALARAYTSIMNQTSYVVEGREEASTIILQEKGKRVSECSL